MYTSYYKINNYKNYDVLNNIWEYVQSTNDLMYMYKKRLDLYDSSWVVEIPNQMYVSYFVLRFGEYVTKVNVT